MKVDARMLIEELQKMHSKAMGWIFIQELRNKRWHAYAVSHEFYFVAPAGLIRLAELDKDDGLIEWTGTDLKIAKPARVRESMPPRWSFVVSIARRVNEVTNGL